MTDFTMTTDADGITVITWDCAEKSMNVLNWDALRTLDGFIDTVIADEAVKGAIITSGKKDFAAGMDLNVLADLRNASGDNPAQGIFDGVMQMHHILRKIERAGMDAKTNKGGKPIVSVLPGTALGIGLEIPLATHRIFAANNPKAKIGLPEIMVGISRVQVAQRGWCANWAQWRPPPICLRGKHLHLPRPRVQASLMWSAMIRCQKRVNSF